MHRWVRRGLVICGLLALGYSVTRLAPSGPSPLASVAHTRHSVVDVPGYSSNGTLEQPTSADIAQVERALRTRAQGVMSGRESEFLSVVDSSRTAFDRAERILWSNSQRLPLEQLTYTYDGQVEPDRPLRTPSFVVHVTTTYQLRGFDSGPIQIEDGYTFVKQGGAWKLASISDADGAFGQKDLPAPWEGPAIATYSDPHYLAIVDRDRPALARHIVSLCHRASTVSGRLLGFVNRYPTVVIATSHSRGFARFSGPEAEAITYRVRGEDNAPAGWRLVVSPRYVDQVVGSPVVLVHELTHLATQAYLPYLPAWLAEGSAEYVGWQSSGGLPVALRARGYVRARRLPDRLPISANFYLQHIQLNYAQSLALVTWIDEHCGRTAVTALFKAYAAAGTSSAGSDPDLATARVLHRVLEMTQTQLTRAAYAEMNASVPHA